MVPPDEAPTRVARRRLLKAAGCAGVAGFAGRTVTATGDRGRVQGGSADADGATADRRADAQDSPVDPEFTAQLSITDPNINFNEFNFANYSWTLTNMLMDPFALYNSRTDEWVPVLATDWSVENGTLVMNLREGYHWHTTGEPVTATDAARSLWLELQMQWSVSEYATDVRATDEYTLEFALRDQFNRNVLEHELLGGTWINKPPHVYDRWIQRFEAASSEEERSQVREELAQWTYDESFGYGPLRVTNRNSQRMVLEPFDGHPRSDAMNFDRYAYEFIGGGNNKVWQAMRANTVDAVPGVFAPKQVVEELPDSWMMTIHPSYGGMGLAFNHAHPDLSQRPVRKAIAYAIDREQVATNAGETVFESAGTVDGLAPQVSEQWFGDWRSTLEAYEYDPERGASILRDAGYRKQGPFWRGPNGRLELAFVAPAGWSDWVTASQTMHSQLKGFGVDARLNTIEASTYNSQTLSSGTWDLAAYGWGGGPYPLFSYQQLWEEEDFTNLSYPREVTVPDPSGSGTTTVQVRELTERIAQDESIDEEGFRRLAWVWNQDLPMLPVVASRSQSFITTDDWAVPSSDADVMAFDPPCTFLPKFGELRAETN